ncbi:TonB-dependent receptor family protein [Alcanivoracaceae bacterium MT1]
MNVLRFTFTPKTPIAAAIGLVFAMTDVSAQAVTELDPIEVQGDWLRNPTEDAVRVYSGARSVIEPEQLHDSGALNIEDAMRSVPGVQVLDETGTGVLPNIGLRGLNPLRSERLQMLINGYPIAIGPYSNVGVSLFPVTLQNIDTIDVVRGGAAVHYGPNNVGGVVNFLTKPISRDIEQTLSERVIIAEDTGHVFHDTYYRIGGFVTDDLALQFQANLQGGEGFRKHSDTDVNNFQIDAEYFLNDRHTLDASLQYYDVDSELPGALSPEGFKKNRTDSQRPHDAFDADMLRGTMAWTFHPNNDVEFIWRNFAHRVDRTFFYGQDLVSGGHWAAPSSGSSHVADSPRLFRVWGTEPRLTVRRGTHTVTLGARYVKENVDFDVNRKNLDNGSRTTVRRWNLETDAVALYASDTLSFMNGRLQLTPGVRYENVSMNFYDALNDTASTNDTYEVLPGLTMGFDATANVFLFANVQKSLVPVQIAQAAQEGEVANETAWNYELGVRVDVAPQLTSSATLFRIDYKDQIQFDKPSDRFVNLGETRHGGVELEANWRATEQLSLGLGYTYLETEQLAGDNAGNDLPNAPRHHVSASARYEVNQWLAYLSVNHFSDSFSDAENTRDETANGDAGELPSVTLVNARIGRDIWLSADATLDLGFSVTNLLDNDAFFRGSDVSPVGRIPMPGRAYILEAQLRF